MHPSNCGAHLGAASPDGLVLILQPPVPHLLVVSLHHRLDLQYSERGTTSAVQ